MKRPKEKKSWFCRSVKWKKPTISTTTFVPLDFFWASSTLSTFFSQYLPVPAGSDLKSNDHPTRIGFFSFQNKTAHLLVYTSWYNEKFGMSFRLPCLVGMHARLFIWACDCERCARVRDFLAWLKSCKEAQSHMYCYALRLKAFVKPATHRCSSLSPSI